MYNLSTHGAFFESTISKKTSNIKIDTFKEISLDFSQLLSILKTNSENKLVEESKKDLQKGLDILEKSFKKDIESFKSAEFINYDAFLEDIVKLTLESKKISHLYQIFVFYNELIIPYLSYFFNNKKIKKEYKILNKTKIVYVKQIEGIIEDYKACISRIL